MMMRRVCATMKAAKGLTNQKQMRAMQVTRMMAGMKLEKEPTFRYRRMKTAWFTNPIIGFTQITAYAHQYPSRLFTYKKYYTQKKIQFENFRLYAYFYPESPINRPTSNIPQPTKPPMSDQIGTEQCNANHTTHAECVIEVSPNSSPSPVHYIEIQESSWTQEEYRQDTHPESSLPTHEPIITDQRRNDEKEIEIEDGEISVQADQPNQLPGNQFNQTIQKHNADQMVIEEQSVEEETSKNAIETHHNDCPPILIEPAPNDDIALQIAQESSEGAAKPTASNPEREPGEVESSEYSQLEEWMVLPIEELKQVMVSNFPHMKEPIQQMTKDQLLQIVHELYREVKANSLTLPEHILNATRAASEAPGTQPHPITAEIAQANEQKEQEPLPVEPVPMEVEPTVISVPQPNFNPTVEPATEQTMVFSTGIKSRDEMQSNLLEWIPDLRDYIQAATDVELEDMYRLALEEYNTALKNQQLAPATVNTAQLPKAAPEIATSHSDQGIVIAVAEDNSPASELPQVSAQPQQPVMQLPQPPQNSELPSQITASPEHRIPPKENQKPKIVKRVVFAEPQYIDDYKKTQEPKALRETVEAKKRTHDEMQSTNPSSKKSELSFTNRKGSKINNISVLRAKLMENLPHLKDKIDVLDDSEIENLFLQNKQARGEKMKSIPIHPKKTETSKKNETISINIDNPDLTMIHKTANKKTEMFEMQDKDGERKRKSQTVVLIHTEFEDGEDNSKAGKFKKTEEGIFRKSSSEISETLKKLFKVLSEG